MIDLTSVIKLTNHLNLIQQVRWMRVRQNEPATEKLAEVLDELSKMVSALDEEIVRYLNLSFNDETVITDRTALLGLEAGQSMVRMGEARGHCHKIITDARVQLTEAMSSLRSMQAEFIAVAKTICLNRNRLNNININRRQLWNSGTNSAKRSSKKASAPHKSRNYKKRSAIWMPPSYCACLRTNCSRS